MNQIKELMKYMSTPEGRLEGLEKLSSEHRLLMFVPHDKRMFSPFTYGYHGYNWDLNGDPKRTDYVQLLRREDTVHYEFCEPVKKPIFKGRLGLIKIIDSEISNGEINLTVTGNDIGKFHLFPYEEVDGLELIVVNEPCR